MILFALKSTVLDGVLRSAARKPEPGFDAFEMCEHTT
jgi:hypothetical protein